MKIGNIYKSKGGIDLTVVAKASKSTSYRNVLTFIDDSGSHAVMYNDVGIPTNYENREDLVINNLAPVGFDASALPSQTLTNDETDLLTVIQVTGKDFYLFDELVGWSPHDKIKMRGVVGGLVRKGKISKIASGVYKLND